MTNTNIIPIAAPIITTLPPFVRLCSMCKGAGQYDQSYYLGINPDRPYTTMRGPCDCCADSSMMLEGPGFVYQDGAKVTESVIAQVLTANNITMDPRVWLRARTLQFPAPTEVVLS